jgi:hypothetical protein
MPLVQNPSIGAGGAPLLTTTVNLSAAQILALSATPITLVPAPGAGKVVVPFSVVLVLNVGSILYSTVGGDLVNVGYANTVGSTNLFQFSDLLVLAASTLLQVGTGSGSPCSILPGADNQALVVQAAQTYPGGTIATATLAAGGTGYVANDTGTIEDGSDNATYKVLTVGALGAVLTFQVTVAGQQYLVENNIPTVNGGAQPGVGTGFEVNVTAVTQGNGTLKATTYYQILAVP